MLILRIPIGIRSCAVLWMLGLRCESGLLVWRMLGALGVLLLLALATVNGALGHRTSICHRICQSRAIADPLSTYAELKSRCKHGVADKWVCALVHQRSGFVGSRKVWEMQVTALDALKVPVPMRLLTAATTHLALSRSSRDQVPTVAVQRVRSAWRDATGFRGPPDLAGCVQTVCLGIHQDCRGASFAASKSVPDLINPG